MITKLEELTMAQFIEGACGNASVLLGKHEIVKPDKLAKAMKAILYEYRAIVDEAGVKSYINHSRDLLKAKLLIVFFKMCNNLIAVGEHERVREVLNVYGINAGTMNDQRVTAEVKSRLERAKRTVAKLESENKTADVEMSGLRSSFDAQTASLMAYFKFQIDISTMKAPIYAHLVARYNREIKAQLSAMKKK